LRLKVLNIGLLARGGRLFLFFSTCQLIFFNRFAYKRETTKRGFRIKGKSRATAMQKNKKGVSQLENKEIAVEFKRNLDRYRKWLAKNAIQRAVKMVLPSFYDGDSRKLEVIVDDKMSPCTDGKKVWVSLIPSALKDWYTLDTWKMLIFVVLCHEIQHNNSSNFEDIELIGKWFAKYVKDKNLPMAEDVAIGIAHEFHNIVEDGRIEAIAAGRRPGMLSGFRCLNNIIRDDTAIEKVAVLPDDEYRDFEGNVLSYAKTGLYAPGIKVYAGTELEKVFLKIKPYIDEGVTAKTSQLCREAVQKLLAEAAEYIASLSEKSEKLQQMFQNLAGQSPEYTQNNEVEYNDSSSVSGSGSPLRSKSPVKSKNGDDSEGFSSAKDNKKKSRRKGKSNSKDAGKGKNSKNSEENSSQMAGESDGKDKPDDQAGKDASTGDGQDGAESGQDGQNDGQDGAGGGKNSQNDGKSNSTEPGTDANGQQDGDGHDGADASPQSSSNSKPTNNTDNTESPMGFCDAIEKPDPLNQAQLDELAQIASQAIDNANAIEAEMNRATNDGLSDADLEKIKSSYGATCYTIAQEALVIPDCAPIPPDLKNQSTVLRREIERITVEKRRSQRGLRQGVLDTNALWKCGVGLDTVFARRRNPMAGSCAFYILIDNSGSTKEEAYRTSGGVVYKYQAERMAAAVIEDAAVGLVPCKIVLFDQTNGAVNHQIIRTFDERSSKNRSWNSLTTVSPGGCNADSVHISIATEELKRRSEQKKVLFTLSDGMPSAYGSKQQAASEVNAAVLDARRKGIIVIPIMFGTEGFLQSHYSAYMNMYAKDVIACVPQEITAKLVYLFRMLIAR